MSSLFGIVLTMICVFGGYLCLMYELVRISRENPVEVEGHIEAPEDSSLFQKYPRILESTAFVEMICDTIRSMLMNFDDVYQVEELLDKQLDGMKEEALHGSHALQNVADALPALGIWPPHNGAGADFKIET